MTLVYNSEVSIVVELMLPKHMTRVRFPDFASFFFFSKLGVSSWNNLICDNKCYLSGLDNLFTPYKMKFSPFVASFLVSLALTSAVEKEEEGKGRDVLYWR